MPHAGYKQPDSQQTDKIRPRASEKDFESDEPVQKLGASCMGASFWTP